MNHTPNEILYDAGHPEKHYLDFKTKLSLRGNQRNKTGNISVFLPVMIKTTESDPCAVKVLPSRGPAYIVTRNVQKPLTQLGRSFINGGQIIGLTLILTFISGVFIWMLVSFNRIGLDTKIRMCFRIYVR